MAHPEVGADLVAGHRKRRDPSARWRERAAKAVTPDEQLAVAYDRLRALIADHRKRDREWTQARAAASRRPGCRCGESHPRDVRPRGA